MTGKYTICLIPNKNPQLVLILNFKKNHTHMISFGTAPSSHIEKSSVRP